MRERGLLNRAEYDALVSANLPPSRWYMVVFVWLMSRTSAALKHGLLRRRPRPRAVAADAAVQLRGACLRGSPMSSPRGCRWRTSTSPPSSSTRSSSSRRSPFYRLGAVSIVLGPLLVLFYRGLLELSKCFLDPFGDRRMSSTDLSADISVDTLLGESNAGSLVWPAPPSSPSSSPRCSTRRRSRRRTRRRCPSAARAATTPSGGTRARRDRGARRAGAAGRRAARRLRRRRAPSAAGSLRRGELDAWARGDVLSSGNVERGARFAHPPHPPPSPRALFTADRLLTRGSHGSHPVFPPQ